MRGIRSSLTDIAGQTCLKGRLAELSGRSVLLAVGSQFSRGLADARDRRHRAAHAAVPAGSQRRPPSGPGRGCRDRCRRHRPAGPLRGVGNCIWSSSPAKTCSRRPRAQTERATEWLMLTSGTLGRAENRRPYARRTDRRDRRRWPGPRRPADLGDVLRHPPLWRPADFPARDHRRRLAGAVGARRADRRPCRAAATTRPSRIFPARRRIGASS